MALLSEGAKQRLQIVVNLTKTVFHYGFIPTVLYLGELLVSCHPRFLNQ